MGLDFRIKDFAYPLSILKLKKTFDKNQWLSKEELRDYQLERLRIIIDHAYKNVPYYQKLFKKNNIIPFDIKTLDDLKIIPPLTKEIVKSSFNSLIADNFKKYQPTLQKTSGTTGGQVKFYTDRTSNILEFVYYWRFWGWAGYRLRDTFAELSAQFFTPYDKNTENICHFQPIMRRLMVNSLLISFKNVNRYIKLFKKYKPFFLKGLPSNLYMLALVFSSKKGHGVSFKAIFSQGENLLQYQRDMIEKVFSCKVFDSYGQMERVAAISQCPLGEYHVHLDYGIVEFDKLNYLDNNIEEGEYIAEIIGTSLYNFVMPLIRYKTKDLVKIKSISQKCLCDKQFPTIESIIGRNADIIETPDGRFVTALYVALDRTPGIVFGQIIQQKLDKLIVIISHEGDNIKMEKELTGNLRGFVGSDMSIEIIHEDIRKIKTSKERKFKVVVSKSLSEEILKQKFTSSFS